MSVFHGSGIYFLVPALYILENNYNTSNIDLYLQFKQYDQLKEDVCVCKYSQLVKQYVYAGVCE